MERVLVRLPLKERGQAMSEFALVMPILVLLMAGMIMAGMYAFRAAAADWGIFITGVAAGTSRCEAPSQGPAGSLRVVGERGSCFSGRGRAGRPRR